MILAETPQQHTHKDWSLTDCASGKVLTPLGYGCDLCYLQMQDIS